MNEEFNNDLKKIRNVVNNYFNLTLQDGSRNSENVRARLIFIKLVSVYYTGKDSKPMSKDILAMAGLGSDRGIPQMLREFESYPDTQEHYKILEHYVVSPDSKFTKEEIKEMLVRNQLTLTEVIDAVIELNNLVGVGLISLGQGVKDYCKSKIIIRDE